MPPVKCATCSKEFPSRFHLDDGICTQCRRASRASSVPAPVAQAWEATEGEGNRGVIQQAHDNSLTIQIICWVLGGLQILVAFIAGLLTGNLLAFLGVLTGAFIIYLGAFAARVGRALLVLDARTKKARTSTAEPDRPKPTFNVPGSSR